MAAGWLLAGGDPARGADVAGGVLVSSAAAGDVGESEAAAGERRLRLSAGRWYTTRQIHGARVLGPGGPASPRTPGPLGEGDGLVAAAGELGPGDVLAMFAADCALVGIVSREGVVGVAHCGWRGLEAGVIQAVAGAMGALGATELAALRGPCIGPECYEFGAAELSRLTARYGPALAGATATGAPALDLGAGVRAAAAEAGISRLVEWRSCTACEPGWFSWRARRDRGRFALAVHQ